MYGGIDIDPASRTLRGIKLGLTVVLLSSKKKKTLWRVVGALVERLWGWGLCVWMWMWMCWVL